MELDVALKGMFATENSLRSREGITNPTFMSENMMRLSQYVGAVEEKLAMYEKDFEIQFAVALKERLIDKHMKVTQAEREVDIETAELKGQIKYLTRLVGSAWKQVGVIQSRINHLVRESQTQT
jgi:hypothetical protein